MKPIRRVAQIVLFAVPVIFFSIDASYGRVDVKCVEAAVEKFSTIVGDRAPSRSNSNFASEAKSLCTLRITPTMQLRAAKEAMAQFYGQRHKYRYYVGRIRGINEYAPTILMFSDRPQRVDVGRLPSKVHGRRIGYVAVSNSANMPPVIAVSSGLPYHLGREKEIINRLSSLGQRGPYRVEAVAGHPMAPVFFIRARTGKRFAYSHVQKHLLDWREITKLIPDLSKITDWTELVSNRLDWSRFVAKRRVQSRQALMDFIIRPAQAWNWYYAPVPCASINHRLRWLKEAWSMPNYMQALYGSANDCGPVAAAMAFAYFNKFTPGLIADSASIGKDYCFGPDWGKYSWPPFPMILKPRWYSPKGSKVLPATTTYRDWYFDHYEIDKNKCTAYQARHKLVYELSKSMPYDSIFGTWDLLTVTPGFDGFIGPTVKAVAAARAKKAATWWTADSDSTKFSTFNWHMDHNNPVLLLIKWPGNTAIGGKHSGEDISVHWMPVIGTYFEDRRAKMCMTSGWCSDCSDSLPDRRYVAVRTGWVEGQATKGGENLVTNYTLGDLGTKFSGPINTNDYTWLNFDESFPLLGSLITLGSDWYYVRFNDKTGGCNKCDPENY